MINKKWRKIGKMNKIERYGQTGQNGEKNTRFKVGLKIKYRIYWNYTPGYNKNLDV